MNNFFLIEKINKSSAIFDYHKLDFFNSYYIREKKDEDLYNLLLPFFQKKGYVSELITLEESQKLKLLIPLIKNRIKKLSDALNMTKFFMRTLNLGI